LIGPRLLGLNPTLVARWTKSSVPSSGTNPQSRFALQPLLGLPLGSVIGFLATHTRCPALIVRGTPSHVEIATPPPTSLTSPQPSPAANAGEAREEVDRSLPVAGAVARADG
jgi:hypothetical protein